MSLIRSLMLAAALTAAACLPALADKKDDTLRFAYDQAPESLDPYFNNVRIGVIVGQLAWDTLIYRDPVTNEYRGQLAKAWKWIDDTTLEVELRQGIVFHNGEAFDADDVVYTLNYVSNPDNKILNTTNTAWLAGAEKVDQFKVRIKLKSSFPAAVEYLAGPVVIHPNEYYAKVGPKGMNDKPVGTGPYRVTENIPGKSIKLERNPNYFKESQRPAPRISKLEIRIIPDRQTQVAEMMAGGLDFVMGVASDQAQAMSASPQLQVTEGETMRIVFLNVNTQETSPTPALRDKRVRQAIGHAIDRETMVKQLVGQKAKVINVACFPSQFGCDDSLAPTFKYDPAKAKALLAEAGFKDGFEVDLVAYRERQQTEAIIGYLKAVGIRANLKFLQYAAMREQVRGQKVGLAHQTWGSFSVNDVSASTPVYFKFLPDDINRDPDVRDLLEKGDTTTDPVARKAAYAKGLALIQERALTVPLYFLTTFYVANKDLSFKAYADEIPRFWEMSWK